jgi:hypothetical protein
LLDFKPKQLCSDPPILIVIVSQHNEDVTLKHRNIVFQVAVPFLWACAQGVSSSIIVRDLLISCLEKYWLPEPVCGKFSYFVHSKWTPATCMTQSTWKITKIHAMVFPRQRRSISAPCYRVADNFLARTSAKFRWESSRLDFFWGGIKTASS